MTKRFLQQVEECRVFDDLKSADAGRPTQQKTGDEAKRQYLRCYYFSLLSFMTSDCLRQPESAENQAVLLLLTCFFVLKG